MIQFTITNANASYTFWPLPAVAISNSYTFTDDTNTMVKRTCSWTVTGVLINKAGTTLFSQVTALQDMLNAGVLKSAALTDTGLSEQMPTERDSGIRISNVEFPEGSGPEFATRRTYSFTLESEEYSVDVNNNGDVQYTISYNTAPSGLVTRTINGLLSAVMNKDAAAKYLTWCTPYLTWENSNILVNEYKVNSIGTSVDFTIAHTKYWAAFPTGITAAEHSCEETTDNQGVIKTVLTGMLEGTVANCDSAIDTIITPYASRACIGKRKIRNDYTNRTEYSFEYIGTATSEPSRLFKQETLVIDEQVTDFVFKRVLGGGNPVKQTTSKTTAKATQAGTIKQLSSYASAPALAWSSTNLKSKQVTRVGAEVTNGADKVFTLNYAYTFEFDSTPNF